MTVFICTDDRGGMMFNKRRQSRDKRVIEDVIRTADDGAIYITDYSESLFAESETSVIAVSDPMASAGKGSYAFIENIPLAKYADKITRLIVYRWNRLYPSDVSMDINPKEIGLKLKNKRDFTGTSHDRITREEYAR